MKLRLAAYGLGCVAIASVVVVAAWSEVEPVRLVGAPTSLDVQDWACPRGTVGRVTCSFVRVPEDYDDPEVSQIRLFVARVPPPTESTEPPLAFIGFGLGGSTVGQFRDWQRVARDMNREIVLIDLRGTGSSQPYLACNEVRVSTWLEQDLLGDGLQSAIDDLRSEVEACRKRLDDRLAVSAYSFDAMAADVDLIRERLEIERWVLAASGEATQVARRAAQFTPEAVDSLVLLGAVPNIAASRDQALVYANEVLTSGVGESGRESLIETAESFDDRSIVFPVAADNRVQRVAVSANVVVPTIARAVEDPEVRAGFDTLVEERVAGQEWRVIAVMRSAQHQAILAEALPARLAMLCGDVHVDDAPPWWDDPEQFTPLWNGLLDDPTLIADLCVSWPTPDHSDLIDPPTQPALVLNGELDVNAPRSAAEAIQSAWDGATVRVLDGQGRPSPFDPCVLGQLNDFLKVPSPTTAAACD